MFIALFPIAVILSWVIWIVWRLLSRDLYNPLILNSITMILWIIDIIGLFFTHDKLHSTSWSFLIVFTVLSLLDNSGWLAKTEQHLDFIEDRRMNIDYWQDVAIDIGYLFLVVQIFATVVPIVINHKQI